MDRVTVAYLDEPPFCIPVPHAEPVGADMELARRALTDAGVVTIDYSLATFPELLPGLIVGRWQMTTGIFITPERSQLIAYSRPIWAAPDGFIVRTGDSDRLTSYEAIAADAHAVLAVVSGQAQHQTALRAGVPSRRIIEFPDQQAATQAVLRRRADAAASTAIGSRAYVRRVADPAVVAVPDRPPASRGSIPLGAFAFNRTAADVISAVDRALLSYLGSPEHLAMMGRYGFSADQLEPILP